MCFLNQKINDPSSPRGKKVKKAVERRKASRAPGFAEKQTGQASTYCGAKTITARILINKNDGFRVVMRYFENQTFN